MHVFDYARDGDAAERDYVAWTEAHPGGYVVNQIGRTIRLHRVGCGHFYDETSGRILTGNVKRCADDRVELERWAIATWATDLLPCATCKT